MKGERAHERERETGRARACVCVCLCARAYLRIIDAEDGKRPCHVGDSLRREGGRGQAQGHVKQVLEQTGVGDVQCRWRVSLVSW